MCVKMKSYPNHYAKFDNTTIARLTVVDYNYVVGEILTMTEEKSDVLRLRAVLDMG